MSGEPFDTISRTTLRGATRDRVRQLIVTGRLSPAANVIERDLSKRLGISRTPLREALLALEAESLLRTEPGRGFFVASLSLEEARELYPLIWTLESMAIRRGRPSDLSQLTELSRHFRSASNPEAALAADRAWHEALVAACRRPRTAAILATLRTSAARYECRYFVERGAVSRSADQHDAITRMLEQKRYRDAATLLRRNWEQGLDWAERSLKAASVPTRSHRR